MKFNKKEINSYLAAFLGICVGAIGLFILILGALALYIVIRLFLGIFGIGV